MTLDLPKRAKLKQRRWAKHETAGELFSVEWFLAIKFLIDQFIRCFHSDLMKSTLLADIFFPPVVPCLYFFAWFPFSGCFINFHFVFFWSLSLNLHCVSFDSRKQIWGIRSDFFCCSFVFLFPILQHLPSSLLFNHLMRVYVNRNRSETNR